MRALGSCICSSRTLRPTCCEGADPGSRIKLGGYAAGAWAMVRCGEHTPRAHAARPRPGPAVAPSAAAATAQEPCTTCRRRRTWVGRVPDSGTKFFALWPAEMEEVGGGGHFTPSRKVAWARGSASCALQASCMTWRAAPLHPSFPASHGRRLTLVKDDQPVKVLAAPLQQLAQARLPALCAQCGRAYARAAVSSGIAHHSRPPAH